MQEAGELIYVPEGWWHAVINVSPWTAAVTHNLVMRTALPAAFAREAARRPLFARRWLACLRRFSPAAAGELEARAPLAVRDAEAADDDDGGGDEAAGGDAAAGGAAAGVGGGRRRGEVNEGDDALRIWFVDLL